MKKLLDTLKRKWTEYFLETIVIVIGILVAFTLNNWNENRKQNNQLNQYRKNLRIELEVDIEKLNRYDSNVARFKKSIVDYLDFYNSNEPNIDTLVSKMDSINYSLNSFKSSAYTIQELISTGNLSTFPEREKKEILKLNNTHENNLYYERESIGNAIFQSEELSKHVDLLFNYGYTTKEHIEVKNWKYDINSSQFRLMNNHIAGVLSLLNFQSVVYKRIKKDTETLLEVLE